MVYPAYGYGLGSLADLLGVTRSKVFISYYHAADQYYYDSLSTTLHDKYELITDRSLDDEIDSDDCDYVMRRIREEFITGTSCTLVLYSASTITRKYVDWEIKATLDKEHALIGIALPSLTGSWPWMPWRLFDNQQSGYAVCTDWLSVTLNPQKVPSLIAEATLKPSWLIKNDREMMACNG